MRPAGPRSSASQPCCCATTSCPSLPAGHPAKSRCLRLERVNQRLVVTTGHAGALARDLPETALRATSPRLTPRPSTVPLTCANVWPREVLQGVVNHRRIDGKDGIVDSIAPGH
jgi:hypothetical protein